MRTAWNRKPHRTHERDHLLLFFINFSPQLPHRQLPGLQHLSAFGHELHFSDFLLPGFQENNSNHIPTALPPHPASACWKRQHLCRQEPSRDSRTLPVCSFTGLMALKSAQCLHDRTRSFKHTTVSIPKLHPNQVSLGAGTASIRVTPW